MVNSHRDIEEDDRIIIDTEPLSGVTFRVSDKQVNDIGLTETLAVTLVSDTESNWSIVGTTADSQVTLEEIGGDGEVQVFWQQISVEE